MSETRNGVSLLSEVSFGTSVAVAAIPPNEISNAHNPTYRIRFISVAPLAQSFEWFDPVPAAYLGRQGVHSSWAYFAAINATVMSSMRLEKPHSLSYQLSTFTSVPPMTRVWVAS